jgi:endo-1,4-beta-xylanase
MRLTRREMLGAAAATMIAGPAMADASGGGLHALAQSKGMRFGSCVSWSPPGADRGSFANPAYAQLLERDCGLLVPENELKWQWVRPHADGYALSRFDAILAYGEAKNMAVRGHTLLWHRLENFPRWLNEHDFGARPRAEAERLLGEHIRVLGQRYGRRLTSFDVVNETVDEHSGALRQTSLSRAFGGTEPMLDFAFHAAKAAAPGVQRVYNDYMSWEPGNEAHRGGVLRLLEGFRRRRVPVDALGVQSHLSVGKDAAPGVLAARQEKAWRHFIDAVVAMGYRVIITELDVDDHQLPSDVVVRDRAVADYATAYLDLMLGYPQLRDMLVWGMCDRYTWLTGFKPRPDGGVQRGTPYDTAFAPKPLHEAIAGALSRATPRSS